MNAAIPTSSSLASIGVNAGVPNLNPADIPANIRNGNAAAQRAYSEGLAFEQILVNQLTTQLASSMDQSSGTGSGAGGASGSQSGAGGSPYAALFPQALTSSIMSGGGLGIAESFARSIDPALNGPAPAPGGGSGPVGGVS